MNFPSFHFLTFGAGRFENAVPRIREQAEKVLNPFTQKNLFSSYTCLTSKDLPKDFWIWHPEHSPTNEKNKRGFGYWVWKPYLLRQEIEKIPENDFLVYFDAGFELYSSDAWRTYLLEVEHSDVLAQNNEPLYLCSYFGSTGIPFYTNGNWTKGDLYEEYEVDLLDPFSLKAQVQSGFLMLRNCKNVRDMIHEWYEKNSNYRLVSDQPSQSPNLSTFVEHRHDQSILNFALFKSKSKRILRIHIFPLLSQPWRPGMAFFSARNPNRETCVK